MFQAEVDFLYLGAIERFYLRKRERKNRNTTQVQNRKEKKECLHEK